MPAEQSAMLIAVVGLGGAGAAVAGFLYARMATDERVDALDERVTDAETRIDRAESDVQSLAEQLRGANGSPGYLDEAEQTRRDILSQIQAVDRRVMGLALGVDEMRTSLDGATDLADVDLDDIKVIDPVVRGGQSDERSTSD